MLNPRTLSVALSFGIGAMVGNRSASLHAPSVMPVMPG